MKNGTCIRQKTRKDAIVFVSIAWLSGIWFSDAKKLGQMAPIKLRVSAASIAGPVRDEGKRAGLSFEPQFLTSPIKDIIRKACQA